MANPYLQVVTRDAEEQARINLNRVKNQRGGKLKLSERQYIEEMKSIWLYAEFCAAERIMRAIECDPDMDNRDNIRAALHIYIFESFKVIKERFNLKRTVSLEDLIDGKYSTEVIMGVKDDINRRTC